METAIRMPYHRMAKPPIWKAIAPGEENISGKIARPMVYVQ